MLKNMKIAEHRGVISHLPVAITPLSIRTTTWCWLDDAGRPTTETFPVGIEVIQVRWIGAAPPPRGQPISWRVQAVRLDRNELIADEPFYGRGAKEAALRFAATGWACFEVIEHTQATA